MQSDTRSSLPRAALATPGDFETPRPPEARSRRDTLRARLTGPRLLRVAATLLRSVRPVLRIGGRTIVTRHEDVREVLRAMGLAGNSPVRVCRQGEPCIVEVRTTRVGLARAIAERLQARPAPTS